MTVRIFPISTGKTTWGDTVNPQWNIQKQESASGLVRAIVEQDLPKYEYSVKFPMLTKSERDSVVGFFNTCKGQLLPFYIKFVATCHMDKQTLGKGVDGKYQLVKKHGDYVEAVDYVENLTVYINDVATTSYTQANGKITLSTTGTVKATYDYYEKVRFSSNLTFTEIYDNLWSCSIKVVTAR